MRPQNAGEGVTDDRRTGLRLEERVSAAAGALDEPVSPCHLVHTVPEQSTGVPNALGEDASASERIRVPRKEERMAAADADVLAHAVTLGQQPVRVVTQEAAQRVPNVRRPAVGVQVGHAASALP